jgi:hypothetical protein
MTQAIGRVSAGDVAKRVLFETISYTIEILNVLFMSSFSIQHQIRHTLIILFRTYQADLNIPVPEHRGI